MSSVVPAGALLSVAVLGLVAMNRLPRWAVIGWLVALCGVPVWAGPTLVIEWEPHVVASIGLVASLVPAVLAGPNRAVARITWADGLMVVFVLAALVPAVAGETTISEVFALVVQWTGAYVAGRLIGYRVPLRWVYGAIAVAFAGVAAMALVEFLTGWNPFVHIPGSGSLYDAWSPIQERGGQARAEGAFGHSIALGASLALAVPLTLAAPFRAAVRIPLVVLMLAAAVVTFSRTGLLTAVLGVALAVLFLRTGLSARLRWAVTGGLVAVAAAAATLVSDVFAAAGAEATDSAGYRADLLTLVPSMQPFGRASSLVRVPNGEQFFGSFHSIDNALLLLGLDYGWVPLVLVVLLLTTGVWCVLAGRATAATVAVVAQIPAFVSVALITQYSTLTWFVAGLAVFSQSLARERPAALPADGPPQAPVPVGAGPAPSSPGMVSGHGN